MGNKMDKSFKMKTGQLRNAQPPAKTSPKRGVGNGVVALASNQPLRFKKTRTRRG